MAAPEDNQFWKLRTKHGRDKTFTPKELEEACEEYFLITSERTLSQKDWVGKDAHEVDREKRVPFHIKTLCLYLGIEHRTWNMWKENKNDSYKDYIPIITRAEDIIYAQKFEGAVVGDFKENIIVRTLGLKEGIEHGGIIPVQNIIVQSQQDADEINKLIQNFENENKEE